MKINKKKIIKNFNEIISELGRQARNRLVEIVAVNILIIFFQIFYIFFRHQYLNPLIPLWYTRNWGDYQLALSNYIIVFPILSILNLITGLFMIAILNKYFVRYIADVVTTFVTISNIFLTYQMLRIFTIATSLFEPMINPKYISLAPYFLFSFFVSYFFLPSFINLMKALQIVTVPGVHSHPSMLLKTPSTRGGGVYFSILFIVLSLLFFGFVPSFLSLYISLILLTMLSFIDDYQNTHPATEFKIIENPFLRLILLASVVSLPVISGIKVNFVVNPLSFLGDYSNFISLYQYNFLPWIVTILWLVWFLNVLSWSNGVDGQFSGIVGVSFILIAFLSLRFTQLTILNEQVAKLAIICAGISFGTVKYMWYPSKIMWGFGAMCAGLVLALFAFMSQTKILTSILIILIPFLDAVVTLFRRMFQGKNPLKGDKGHLHHILLANGWSVSKIAIFYWLTTALFGLIGFFTADKYTIQTGLAIAGFVAFIIISANINFLKSKDEGSVPRDKR